jgi:hypothetical protein
LLSNMIVGFQFSVFSIQNQPDGDRISLGH